MADESESSGAQAAESTPSAQPDSQASQRHAQKTRSDSLIEKYAARAQIAADKEMAEQGVEPNHDRLEYGRDDSSHSTAHDPNDLTRGKDGKFQKKEPKPKADKTESPGDQADGSQSAAPTPPGDSPIDGELAEVQKLVADGKIADALRKIGINTDGLTGKQWESFRKDHGKQKAAIERSKQEVAQRYQQVEQWAGQLEQEHAAFRQAKQALASGDLEGMARALGTSFDELNRRAIQQMANKDPRVAELEARLAQNEQAQRQQQHQAQQAQVWNNNLRVTHQNLQAEKDPRITAALEDPTFAPAVLNHIMQANDPDLTFGEAARTVLNHVATQYQRMQKIFGGGAPAPAPAVGGGKSASREEPSGRVSPVKPRTQLSSRGAAEAHAEKPLRGNDLMNRYVRQAIALRATELSEIADD